MCLVVFTVLTASFLLFVFFFRYFVNLALSSFGASSWPFIFSMCLAGYGHLNKMDAWFLFGILGWVSSSIFWFGSVIFTVEAFNLRFRCFNV